MSDARTNPAAFRLRAFEADWITPLVDEPPSALRAALLAEAAGWLRLGLACGYFSGEPHADLHATNAFAPKTWRPDRWEDPDALPQGELRRRLTEALDDLTAERRRFLTLVVFADDSEWRAELARVAAVVDALRAAPNRTFESARMDDIRWALDGSVSYICQETAPTPADWRAGELESLRRQGGSVHDRIEVLERTRAPLHELVDARLARASVSATAESSDIDEALATDEAFATDLVRVRLFDEGDAISLAGRLVDAGELVPQVEPLAAAGRRALAADGYVQLEALGESFAKDLEATDAMIATTDVELETERERFRRIERPRATARRGLVLYAGLLVAALLAAFGQVALARTAFSFALAGVPATTAALAYVVGVAGVAAVLGWAAGSRRVSYVSQFAVGAVVAVASIAIALITTHPLAASGNAVPSALLLAILGLLLPALAAAAGYRFAERSINAREAQIAHELGLQAAYQRHVAAVEARTALLRSYFARGSTLLARASRYDALYVYEALRSAPWFEELDRPFSMPVPEWLIFARDELERARQESAGATESARAEAP